MIFDWFKIFNLTDWLATDLTSRQLTIILGNYGQKDLLITQGNCTSVLFDTVFLPLNLNDKNPFVFEERAIYVDANNDVWIGVQLED